MKQRGERHRVDLSQTIGRPVVSPGVAHAAYVVFKVERDNAEYAARALAWFEEERNIGRAVCRDAEAVAAYVSDRFEPYSKRGAERQVEVPGVAERELMLLGKADRAGLGILAVGEVANRADASAGLLPRFEYRDRVARALQLVPGGKSGEPAP